MAYDIGAKIGIDGEKAYREALTNINKDLKVLTSEMKLNASEFSQNANSMAALEKKSELLNKQYDVQKEKVEALKNALSNASNTYGENSNQVKEWQIKLNNAESSLNSLDNELKLNDKYLDEAKNSTDNCATSIDNMGKQTKIAGDKALTTGDVFKASLGSQAVIAGVQALGTAVESVTKGVVNLGAAAASYADNIMTMSTVTGVSTDNLQAYSYMAELTDTSLEYLTSSMAKNIKSMGNAQKGTEDYVNAYKRLNVEYEDGNGRLRDSEEVYWDVVDALSSVENETERDTVAMQIFGKSAQELNTLISTGSTGVKKLTDEASKMGAILDTKTLKSLGETDDTLQRFNQTVEITKRKIGSEMAPALTEAADDISEKINEVGDDLSDFAGGAVEVTADALIWLIENADLATTAVGGLVGASVATKVITPIINTVVMAWTAHKAATDGATISQWALNAAQSANPVGLIVTAVAAAASALVTYSLLVKDVVSEEQELVNSHIEQANSLAENTKKILTSADDTKNETIAITKLKIELINLNNQEKLSNEEKSKMVQIVGQLNTAIPELNLSINEQTGYVNGTTDAFTKLIDANIEYLKVSAAQEQLVEIAKQQYDAEIELASIQKDKSEALLIAQEAEAAYKKEVVGSVGATKEHSVILADLYSKMVDANKVVDDYSVAEKSLNEAMQGTTAAFDEATAYIKNHTEATEAETQAQITYKNTLYTVSSEVADNITTITTSYNEAKAAALESINSQIGLFDELSLKSDLSVQQIAENLASQAEVFSTYSQDLIKAQELVSQGFNQKMLSAIQELGVGGAGYLHELVTSFETDKDAFNEAINEWAKMEGAKETLSETMGDLKTSYSEQMNGIFGLTEESTNSVYQSALELSGSVGNMAFEAQKSALEMSAAVGNMAFGYKNSADETKKAATTTVNGMISTVDLSLGLVDGKSTVMQSKGYAASKSLADGILQGGTEINTAINTIWAQKISNFDTSALAEKIDVYLGENMR